VQRLSEHLSSVTFFSERYGQIGAAEASLHAQRIEQDAFLAASRNVDLLDASDIAVVQFYAKEASRLMLECLKKGPSRPKEPETRQIEAIFDISGGQRDFLTEASAQELLQPLAVPGNAYSGICLSNRSFGEDAAKVAAKILETLKSQLDHVNLADIVAGRNEEEALAVMSLFSSALSGSNLKYLNLSHNALGEKGIRAFAELLASQRSLEELYFMNNGISEEAAVAIRELLPSSASLKVLHFHNNMTGDDGAVALASLVKEAPLLEDFRCSSTRVGSEGGIALSEALLAGSCLKKLDLHDNPFGVEGALALAKTLKQHRSLKEVYLSYLGLEDEGTLAILEAMEESGSELEVLDLAGNDITVSSLPKLASFIMSKPKLVKLNLSENDLGDKGVVTICNVLGKGHEALVELDLSETNIGRIGACAAAEAISLKSGFKVLNLNGNHISEAGIEALKDLLQRGRHGGISVLGTLEENDENEDDAEDEDNGNEGENGDDQLQAEFQKVKV
jgi:Ran GTPase-activating protein 1